MADDIGILVVHEEPAIAAEIAAQLNSTYQVTTADPQDAVSIYFRERDSDRPNIGVVVLGAGRGPYVKTYSELRTAGFQKGPFIVLNPPLRCNEAYNVFPVNNREFEAGLLMDAVAGVIAINYKGGLEQPHKKVQ